jgi:hypothetical protein
MKIKPAETKYWEMIKIQGEGHTEDVEIIQESVDREAIKVKIFEERWRSPKITVEFLRKVADLIEENFIK